jgi:hypothetical protein
MTAVSHSLLGSDSFSSQPRAEVPRVARFFSGCCVGALNMKYFILWTFWLCFGCTYGALHLFAYVFFCDRWTARPKMNLADYSVTTLPLVCLNIGK